MARKGLSVKTALMGIRGGKRGDAGLGHPLSEYLPNRSACVSVRASRSSFPTTLYTLKGWISSLSLLGTVKSYHVLIKRRGYRAQPLFTVRKFAPSGICGPMVLACKGGRNVGITTRLYLLGRKVFFPPPDCSKMLGLCWSLFGLCFRVNWHNSAIYYATYERRNPHKT